MKIEELGFIDKGTGKHQSNIVYTVSMETIQKESRLNSLSKSIDDN